MCGTTDVTEGGTFSVVAGATTACTITNRLKQGTLVVRKQVINDNGGTALPADFTLDIGVDGESPFPGDHVDGTTFTLNDGVQFTVTEGVLAGYIQGNSIGDCTGTIVANETKSCTLVNDDQAPSLTLVKVVENNAGGIKTAADFTLTATGASTISGLGPTVNSGATFQAGAYTLSESTVAGYTVKTDWSCSFGTSGGSQAGSVVTLGVGQSATCTITNQDAKASPDGSTVQRAILHDSMTITCIRPGASDAAAARVVFKLFSNASCTTQVGVDESRTITSGVATTVNGVLVTGTGVAVYYWTAAYSGDEYNNSFTKGCGVETTTVNFQNNNPVP